MSRLRIGFVGLGNQARENLLPAIAQMESARLAAVCDIADGRAKEMANFVGQDGVFTDLGEMVNSGKIDFVVMACPPEVHAVGARLAIEAGLPVFVEKPPCLTTETLIDLADLAGKRNVITGVGLNFRFAHPIARMRSILSSSRFGGLAHLELRHLANKPRAPMWSLKSLVRSFLLAQTIHAFDLGVSLGGELADIDADVDEVRPGALIIRVHLRFADGATASVLTGSAFPAFEFGLTAFGRNHGLITLDNLWTLSVRDEAGGVFRPGEKRWSETWVPGPLESGHSRAGYLGELEAFVSAISSNRQFEASFAALLPTYEIIDAVVDTPIGARSDRAVARFRQNGVSAHA